MVDLFSDGSPLGGAAFASTTRPLGERVLPPRSLALDPPPGEPGCASPNGASGLHGLITRMEGLRVEGALLPDERTSERGASSGRPSVPPQRAKKSVRFRRSPPPRLTSRAAGTDTHGGTQTSPGGAAGSDRAAGEPEAKLAMETPSPTPAEQTADVTSCRPRRSARAPRGRSADGAKPAVEELAAVEAAVAEVVTRHGGRTRHSRR